MTSEISMKIQQGILNGWPEIKIVGLLRNLGYVVSEMEILKEFTRLRKLLEGANIK
jgi:hypothetical protein